MSLPSLSLPLSFSLSAVDFDGCKDNKHPGVFIIDIFLTESCIRIKPVPVQDSGNRFKLFNMFHGMGKMSFLPVIFIHFFVLKVS